MEMKFYESKEQDRIKPTTSGDVMVTQVRKENAEDGLGSSPEDRR